MIESASYRICVIDGLPIEESQVYETITQECGKQTADKWTEEVTVNLTHPPPEVPHGNHRVNVVDGRTLARPHHRRRVQLPNEKVGSVRSEKTAAARRK